MESTIGKADETMTLGLSSCSKTLDRALFAAYAEAGIFRMELSLGREGCDALECQQTKTWADEFGIKLGSFVFQVDSSPAE